MLEVDSHLEGNMATDHGIKKILAPYQSEEGKHCLNYFNSFLKRDERLQFSKFLVCRGTVYKINIDFIFFQLRICL